MKKRIFVLFVLLLSIIATTAGCSEYKAVTPYAVPDSKYAVTSNGGSVVQVGNLIYFVNGYDALEDTEENKNERKNEWGDVVKGAISIAKLSGGSDLEISNDYYSRNGKKYLTYQGANEVTEESAGFELDTVDYKDKNGDQKTDTFIVNKVFVPKLVSRVGENKVNGLYIIDGFIYYTSPNNQKSRKGEAQYELVDFFRTSLDGKLTQKLYTSKSTDTKPVFGYYYYNDATYLVVYEGGLKDKPVYSIKAKGNKVSDPKKIAVDVTGVAMAAKSVFYKDMDQNMVEDYVYYTIADEKNQNKNITIMVRPDGDNATRKEIFSGSMVTLDKVVDGFLFYTVKDKNKTNYCATDLAQQRGIEGATTRTHFIENADSYSNIFGIMYSYYLEDNDKFELLIIANDASNNVVAITEAADPLNFVPGVTKILPASGKIAIHAVDGDYIYYTEGEATNVQMPLKKLNYNPRAAEETINFETKANINLSGFKPDIAAGYIFYVSIENNIPGYDEMTRDYMKLQKAYTAIDASKGIEWDILTVSENDLPKEETNDTQNSETK